jgi:hypothetical protein
MHMRLKIKLSVLRGLSKSPVVSTGRCNDPGERL